MIQLAIVVLAASVVLGAGFAYAWCVNREQTDSDTKVRVEGQP